MTLYEELKHVDCSWALSKKEWRAFKRLRKRLRKREIELKVNVGPNSTLYYSGTPLPEGILTKIPHDFGRWPGVWPPT
jgi:hypothetical protein